MTDRFRRMGILQRNPRFKFARLQTQWRVNISSALGLVKTRGAIMEERADEQRWVPVVAEHFKW